MKHHELNPKLKIGSNEFFDIHMRGKKKLGIVIMVLNGHRKKSLILIDYV